MAWLKSHQSLRDHPKTRKLARRLGVRLPEAVGILHCLWWWCMDYADDGDLTKHDHEDIAIACEWDGDPETIISELVACGFIDSDDGLYVHDWLDYGGTLVMQRDENRERARRNYEKKRSLREDCAKTTQPERKIDRKKERTGGRTTQVGKSPARASEQGIDCVPLKDAIQKSVEKLGGAA